MITPADITKASRSSVRRFWSRGFLCVATIVCVLFLAAQNAFAIDVTLAWDENGEEDLAGYRVFFREQGEAYDYDQPAWQGTDTTCTIYNLDDDTTYYFVARAFDTLGDESGDSNEVCYESSENDEPTAHAGGDRTVDEGDTVTLDSSGSFDPDGSIVSFAWTQTAGEPVTLSDPSAAQPTFTAPDVGPAGTSLTFQLTVTDRGGLQSTDTCSVDVSWVNMSPTADAGPNQTVKQGATVTLDGSNSTDPDCSIESYLWTQISGTGVTLSDAAEVQTTFVAPSLDVEDEALVFQLEVTDEDGLKDTATVIISVSVVNQDPVAEVPESNLGPLTPVITSPYGGQTECDLLVHITSESFSDPDGDSHGQSHWQISKDPDFSSLVLALASADHRTDLPVPHAVLDIDTTYFVRVRFYDGHLEPSSWSDAVEFATTSLSNDIDGNGIPDDQEVGYDVDLNEDGIADSEQPDVIKCVRSIDDSIAVGVSKASDSIRAIEAVEMVDPSTISERTMRPQKILCDLFSYRLLLNQPGAMATVKIILSKDISKARFYYKYDTINGWQDYSSHTTFNEDGRSITLQLQDGGYGDCDGIMNGIIVDPGVLAEEPSDGDPLGYTGGEVITRLDNAAGGGGCFIGAAASMLNW